MARQTSPGDAAKPAAQPSATRGGRIADYLLEMFPPWLMVPAIGASVASAWLSLDALAGRTPRVTWQLGLVVLSVVVLSALMRVYDELKDVETDLRLGRAGDPRYVNRPIVTGRIRVEDLRALRGILVVAAIVCNLPLGLGSPLAVFAALLFYMWLTSRWFFLPVISRYLLLAFLTHTPVAMAMTIYTAVVWRAGAGVPLPPGTVPLIVGMWTLNATWETARKVRAPEDETDYQTYSKVLGHRGASLLSAAIAASGAVLLEWVARRLGLSIVFEAVLGVAALVFVGTCLRFVVSPLRGDAPLRPLAELLGVIASIGLPIAICIRYGLRIG